MKMQNLTISGDFSMQVCRMAIYLPHNSIFMCIKILVSKVHNNFDAQTLYFDGLDKYFV